MGSNGENGEEARWQPMTGGQAPGYVVVERTAAKTSPSVLNGGVRGEPRDVARHPQPSVGQRGLRVRVAAGEGGRWSSRSRGTRRRSRRRPGPGDCASGLVDRNAIAHLAAAGHSLHHRLDHETSRLAVAVRLGGNVQALARRQRGNPLVGQGTRSLAEASGHDVDTDRLRAGDVASRRWHPRRRTAAFSEALDPVADRVETRIDALLVNEQKRWIAVDPALGDPLDALREFVAAGGKRLRPAFCACAFVGAGGSILDDPAVIDAAAALELVHTFALVHDDIMDGSDTRRGRDAVHRQFARRHEDESWRGPARRFGDGMAILVGDFALVYADILLRGAPADAQEIYDELRVELCVGQSLDLVGTATARTDAETARRISTYKSGKYTVERPLHLGAALAGRDEELSGPLSAIGLPMGEAFQLRDDVLGAFGETAVTGKPVGDDLLEGKSPHR